MVTYDRAFEALGDGTRRSILQRLADGPLPVGSLAAGLPVSRPAVSQHLKVLKAAGLVSDRQVGTRRIYAVDPAGLAAVAGYWDRVWGRALDRYREATKVEAARLARSEGRSPQGGRRAGGRSNDQDG